MGQLLPFSWPGERAKRGAAHICKIAFFTIPRCGWVPLALLWLGLLMIFPASQTAMHLHTERSTPYELIASTQEARIDLESLTQISGVEGVSPIQEVTCQLRFEEKEENFEIDGVYSSYLDLELIEGAIFTDDTNMPYLLLNEAAAKAFSEREDDPPLPVGESLTLKWGDVETKAIVCGIFQSEDTTPKLYMSYEVAKKLFPDQDSITELVFRLGNKGSLETAASELKRQKFSADVDSDTILAWDLLIQQTWQMALVSLLLVGCSALLIRERLSKEKKETRGERNALLSQGLTLQEVRRIVPLRLGFADLTTGGIAIVTASFFQIFSPLGIVLTLFLGILHWGMCTYHIPPST